VAKWLNEQYGIGYTLTYRRRAVLNFFFSFFCQGFFPTVIDRCYKHRKLHVKSEMSVEAVDQYSAHPCNRPIMSTNHTSFAYLMHSAFQLGILLLTFSQSCMQFVRTVTYTSYNRTVI